VAQDVLDVAIVGGGVSGVWSGWRLTDPSAGPARRKRVGVFELSDRIGGRLLSVRLPGQPTIACELGGMRYMSSQPTVKWLIEDELGLPTIPAPVGEDQNIAYLRGQLLRLKDLTDPDKIPFHLLPDERGRAATLLSDAIAAIAPSTVGKTGDALRKAVQSVVYDGRPIWEQGFWNMLAQNMSSEAYRFTQQSGGYDTTQLNWNGADTIVLNSDFGPTVTYSRVETGYENVPIQLALRFQANGGELHLKSAVRSIVPATLPDDTEGVLLLVDDAETNKTIKVLARSAILAMPRRSLELMDPAGPILGDPVFRELMTTVTPIPLFKSFVAYHEPWWTNIGITAGRSVTDLPLRQVYYWSTTPTNSMLLATYDDTDDVGFWQGLAVDPERFGLETGHLPAAAGAAIQADTGDERWKAWQAPAAMVAEIHRELMVMHGVAEAPPPYAAVYHDWLDDPFGGGVNFWNIGVKSWEVIAKIAKPVAKAPVYVVGEAYSDAQGWVEGALRSAEIVLTTHLGLPPVKTQSDAGS
jgi:monoamine oxidase